MRGTETVQGLDWRLVVHLFMYCQPSQISTYITQRWTSVTAQCCLPSSRATAAEKLERAEYYPIL